MGDSTNVKGFTVGNREAAAWISAAERAEESRGLAEASRYSMFLDAAVCLRESGSYVPSQGAVDILAKMFGLMWTLQLLVSRKETSTLAN